MVKARLQFAFTTYLGLSIIMGANVMLLGSQSDGPKGIYATICGTGQMLFIPLNEDGQPEPSGPHMIACHAICANEELEYEEGA